MNANPEWWNSDARTLPGHPVQAGAGYDCNCGACLSLPARRTCDDCGAAPGEPCAWSCSSNWDAP